MILDDGRELPNLRDDFGRILLSGDTVDASYLGKKFKTTVCSYRIVEGRTIVDLSMHLGPEYYDDYERADLTLRLVTPAVIPELPDSSV